MKVRCGGCSQIFEIDPARFDPPIIRTACPQCGKSNRYAHPQPLPERAAEILTDPQPLAPPPTLRERIPVRRADLPTRSPHRTDSITLTPRAEAIEPPPSPTAVPGRVEEKASDLDFPQAEEVPQAKWLPPEGEEEPQPATYLEIETPPHVPPLPAANLGGMKPMEPEASVREIPFEEIPPEASDPRMYPAAVWGATAGILIGLVGFLWAPPWQTALLRAGARSARFTHLLRMVGETGHFILLGLGLAWAARRRPSFWDYYPGMLLFGAGAALLQVPIGGLAWLLAGTPGTLSTSGLAGPIFYDGLTGLLGGGLVLALSKLGGGAAAQTEIPTLDSGRRIALIGFGLAALLGLAAQISLRRIHWQLGAGASADPAAAIIEYTPPAGIPVPQPVVLDPAPRRKERAEPRQTTPLVEVASATLLPIQPKYPEDLTIQLQVTNTQDREQPWVVKVTLYDKAGDRMAWRLIANGIPQLTDEDLMTVATRDEVYNLPDADPLQAGETRRTQVTFFGFRPDYHRFEVEAIDFAEYRALSEAP